MIGVVLRIVFLVQSRDRIGDKVHIDNVYLVVPGPVVLPHERLQLHLVLSERIDVQQRAQHLRGEILRLLPLQTDSIPLWRSPDATVPGSSLSSAASR